jgi:large subunit ribosomal protein L3
MVGLIGTKVGMTQVFDEIGVLTPVTVIKIEDNTVLAKRDIEVNGYNAVLIGAGEMKPGRVTKPYGGQFKDKITPKKHLFELRDFDGDVSVGDTLSVEILKDTKYVDVIGKSKGKGYQGVMKRHGFSGGRKTHGSKFHRAPGSTGMAATPSRVIKGTKMPGRMGGEKNTVQNLRVVGIDDEKKVILLQGSVPGTRDTVVIVKTAKKKG